MRKTAIFVVYLGAVLLTLEVILVATFASTWFVVEAATQIWN